MTKHDKQWWLERVRREGDTTIGAVGGAAGPPLMVDRYSPYVSFETAGGGWVSMATCLLCGAAVFLEMHGPNRFAEHQAWHVRQGHRIP